MKATDSFTDYHMTGIANEYGGIRIRVANGNEYYWTIDGAMASGWIVDGELGEDWQRIPYYLFAALIEFETKGLSLEDKCVEATQMKDLFDGLRHDIAEIQSSPQSNVHAAAALKKIDTLQTNLWAAQTMVVGLTKDLAQGPAMVAEDCPKCGVHLWAVKVQHSPLVYQARCANCSTLLKIKQEFIFTHEVTSDE